MEGQKLLYDLRAAAEMISISHWTLRRKVLNGELKPTHVGRRVLISRTELERFAKHGPRREPRPRASAVRSVGVNR